MHSIGGDGQFRIGAGAVPGIVVSVIHGEAAAGYFQADLVAGSKVYAGVSHVYGQNTDFTGGQ